MTQLPLEGIRVVALEQYISGPYCTMWLADAGAEVIKVERPDGGDPRREFMPRFESDDGQVLSGGFLSFNRNKSSVTLDLQQEEGRQAYRDLVATADVVVENLRPGVVEKLGIAYQDLIEVRPDLVYAGISGYGRVEGHPYAGRSAFDAAILGMSGITYVTGPSADKPPMQPMYGLADMMTAILSGYQILMSLFERERTGKGRYIDVSMYDTLVSINERSLMQYAFTNDIPTRGPDKFQAPMGAFECSDGYISLVCPNDLIWRRLAACMGRSDLAEDPITATGASRAAHPDAFMPEMTTWMKSMTRDECVAALEKFGVPVGLVQNAADISNCAHLEARDMFVRVQDPEFGEIRMPHAPFGLADTPPVPTRSVPKLGADNDRILGELGLNPEDIARATGSAPVATVS